MELNHFCKVKPEHSFPAMVVLRISLLFGCLHAFSIPHSKPSLEYTSNNKSHTCDNRYRGELGDF